MYALPDNSLSRTFNIPNFRLKFSSQVYFVHGVHNKKISNECTNVLRHSKFWIYFHLIEIQIFPFQVLSTNYFKEWILKHNFVEVYGGLHFHQIKEFLVGLLFSK